MGRRVVVENCKRAKRRKDRVSKRYKWKGRRKEGMNKE